MIQIVLTSEILTVVKINRKTQAKMFKELKIGDKIMFSVPLEYAGRNRGTYATYIEAKNIETGETNYSSFNQLPNILKSFELKVFTK